MGNGESINVVLDDDAPIAGQSLRGKVLVQTKCAIQSGVLVVHMDGKEKVGIRQLSDAGITSRAERQFYATRLTLRDFASKPVTWSGTYEFPFAIALPACLPASTSHPRETRVQGLRIQYKLRIRWQHHALERCVIVRSAPLPITPSPALPEPAVLPVRGMLRQSRGSVILGVHIPDTQVERGGALQVRLACRHDSQIRVQGLRLRVVEECRWSSLRHESRHKHILATMADVQLPELQGTCRGGKPVSLDTNSAYREIHDSLGAGLNTVQIHIPAQAKTSYQGQLLRISHWVEVQLQSSRSWASQPSQVIPIRVGEPRSQPSPPPQLVTPPNRSTAGMGLPMAVVIEDDANAVPTNFNVPIVYAVNATDYDDHDDCTVLGGESVALDDLVLPHGTDVRDGPTAPLSTLIPLPAPQRHQSSTPPLQRDVALSTLRRELAKSVGACDLLRARLLDPAWTSLLERLDPDEYGSLLSEAFVPEHDQVRLAEDLARALSRVGRFTCAHVAAALWTTSPASRSTLLPTLLPLCKDLSDQRQLIEGELSVWERLVAGPEFDQTRIWCNSHNLCTTSERRA